MDNIDTRLDFVIALMVVLTFSLVLVSLILEIVNRIFKSKFYKDALKSENGTVFNINSWTVAYSVTMNKLELNYANIVTKTIKLSLEDLDMDTTRLHTKIYLTILDVCFYHDLEYDSSNMVDIPDDLDLKIKKVSLDLSDKCMDMIKYKTD